MYNSLENITPRIGEVYNMYFESTGSEQSGWRPGVVFQNNKGNSYSPNIIALPVTSSLKKLYMPTHVFISSSDTDFRYDSMVMCENPTIMSKDKIGFYITTLPDKYMKEIVEGYLLATSAISFLDPESLYKLWEQASKYNEVA